MMHLSKNNIKPNSSKLLTNVYIKSTLKNTLVTVKQNNSVILQISSKSLPKIKNQKPNNFHTLKELSKEIVNVIRRKDSFQLKIFIKGVGIGKSILIKNLSYNFLILSIHDLTPIPFNGCRPKKQKRR